MMSEPEIVESLCAMANDVRPLRAASSASCTTFSLWVSRALVASSSSSTEGFRTKALQMATRCFCPPERRLPRGPTSVSNPLFPSLNRKPRLAICWHSSKRSVEIVSPSSRPYMMFSRTVVLKSTGSCPTKPT
mmetsp:Transcript_32662/g.52563  ORF Transcript_32662/g.52563 Transcript_32662/m.52563 type:complete len:133 (+) Transcript_32662:497-895(+)